MEIKHNKFTWSAAAKASSLDGGLNPERWLEESANIARSYVYSPEIMRWIKRIDFRPDLKKPIDLSEQYLASASELSQTQAALAAHRLAAILIEGVAER